MPLAPDVLQTIGSNVYTDGGLNNPIWEAYIEVQDVPEFHKRKLVILSLGTGYTTATTRVFWVCANTIELIESRAIGRDSPSVSKACQEPIGIRPFCERLSPELPEDYPLDDSWKLRKLEQVTTAYLGQADMQDRHVGENRLSTSSLDAAACRGITTRIVD